MKNTLKLVCLFMLFGVCYLLVVSYSNEITVLSENDKIEKYYQNNKGNSLQSISVGSVSDGSIKNSKLIPFSGDNYQYFDRWSYLNGRAFLNGDVLKAVLQTYDVLQQQLPKRWFNIMECSHKDGGKLFPHRTHQNGLSVDFMMPLIKGGKAYYELDNKGIKHYLLDFDNSGRYSKDHTVSIDFNLVAKHILELNSQANKEGLKIVKVIIKIELKDELFNSKYGKILKNSGIYIVKGLTPKINELHDDHYHIDFGLK